MSICVLTGDIVGSTELTSAQQARIKSLIQDIPYHLVRPFDCFVDLYRGDGWQMAFKERQFALRFSLYVRATLKAEHEAFETRIALAEGTEMLEILNPSTQTFIASGRALDDMPRDVLMSHASGGARHGATLLADHISRGWTQAQARAIKPFLRPNSHLTQKDVAADLGVSRQAVGQALDAAGYPVIDRALRAIEEQAQ